MGFRQRANGPLVISLPGWKYFKKYTAEYTQKINPIPNQKIPNTLNRSKSINLRSKNSGYLIIIINARSMYGRHKRASFGPHPKRVILFFIFPFDFVFLIPEKESIRLVQEILVYSTLQFYLLLVQGKLLQSKLPLLQLIIASLYSYYKEDFFDNSPSLWIHSKVSFSTFNSGSIVRISGLSHF